MAKGNAESLSEVLELARTRRLNGMITIAHKQGGRVEEGEVYFQIGQLIQARVGRLIGQDALNWLMKWHNITYMIETDDSLQSVAKTPVNDRDKTTPTPFQTFVPSNKMPFTEQAVAQVEVNERSSIHSNIPTPGIEWLVPQKRGVVSEVLALPLTRRQRFIYFLVDGRRNVADLARCTGKNTQEIELILSELQEQGLVAV
jgi:hypothetical protein